MRHRVKGRKLNRNVNQRRALFRALVTSLIENGSIKTSEAKAKAIKGTVDKLISKAKADSVHQRRLIAKYLSRRSLVNRLIDEISPATGKRTSGFTRIIKLGNRRGDDTMMVKMEFVDDIKAMSQEIREKTTASVSDKEVKKSTKSSKTSSSVSAKKKKNQTATDQSTKKTAVQKKAVGMPPIKSVRATGPINVNAPSTKTQRTTNK